jgi:hypothetical protein
MALFTLFIERFVAGEAANAAMLTEMTAPAPRRLAKHMVFSEKAKERQCAQLPRAGQPSSGDRQRGEGVHAPYPHGSGATDSDFDARNSGFKTFEVYRLP